MKSTVVASVSATGIHSALVTDELREGRRSDRMSSGRNAARKALPTPCRARLAWAVAGRRIGSRRRRGVVRTVDRVGVVLRLVSDCSLR